MLSRELRVVRAIVERSAEALCRVNTGTIAVARRNGNDNCDLSRARQRILRTTFSILSNMRNQNI
jgi:hypothetical protein